MHYSGNVIVVKDKEHIKKQHSLISSLGLFVVSAAGFCLKKSRSEMYFSVATKIVEWF